MRITDLTDKKATAGHWRSVDHVDAMSDLVRSIWHYDTRMLTFQVDTKEILYCDTGNGSVSDQNGMNKLFRKLGSSLYYSRKGGARIE